MRRSSTSFSEITYAGIDYHKRSITVALGDKDGNLIRHEKLFNDEAAIRAFFGQFPKITCAIETCRGFEWLLDLLSDMGIEVKVCHAQRLKLIAETAFKTDKIDSAVIMRLLAKNFLPLVHFPTKQQQYLKERLRWRIHLMRTSTRIKLRIHALLDKENKGLACNDPFTIKGREYLESVKLSEPRRHLLDKHLDVLDEIAARQDDEYKWIKRLVENDPKATLLLTVPGFGIITAATLIAEIGDVSRFKRAEQLSKYFGLVPTEDSSGDRQRQGGISKEGNSLVRWLLIQDAWQAVHTSPDLRNKFLRISLRRGKHGKKIAIVAIARTLAEIAFNVLKHGKGYSAQRVALGQPAACTNTDESMFSPECCSVD